MAVRAMTGADEDYIWHKLPLACGLQYHAMWWQRENEIRQRSSINKVQEIFVFSNIDPEEKVGAVIV
jgi:hypothetical protein